MSETRTERVVRIKKNVESEGENIHGLFNMDDLRFLVSLAEEAIEERP